MNEVLILKQLIIWQVDHLSPIMHKRKDLASKVLSYFFICIVTKSMSDFCFLFQNQIFLLKFNDNSKKHKHLKSLNPCF